jgi:hypothetical protein
MENDPEEPDSDEPNLVEPDRPEVEIMGVYGDIKGLLKLLKEGNCEAARISEIGRKRRR